jgi:hypothetical protein
MPSYFELLHWHSTSKCAKCQNQDDRCLELKLNLLMSSKYGSLTRNKFLMKSVLCLVKIQFDRKIDVWNWFLISRQISDQCDALDLIWSSPSRTLGYCFKAVTLPYLLLITKRRYVELNQENKNPDLEAPLMHFDIIVPPVKESSFIGFPQHSEVFLLLWHYTKGYWLLFCYIHTTHALFPER